VISRSEFRFQKPLPDFLLQLSAGSQRWQFGRLPSPIEVLLDVFRLTHICVDETDDRLD
jgi:hypothetical protein